MIPQHDLRGDFLRDFWEIPEISERFLGLQVSWWTPAWRGRCDLYLIYYWFNVDFLLIFRLIMMIFYRVSTAFRLFSDWFWCCSIDFRLFSHRNWFIFRLKLVYFGLSWRSAVLVGWAGSVKMLVFLLKRLNFVLKMLDLCIENVGFCSPRRWRCEDIARGRCNLLHMFLHFSSMFLHFSSIFRQFSSILLHLYSIFTLIPFFFRSARCSAAQCSAPRTIRPPA